MEYLLLVGDLMLCNLEPQSQGEWHYRTRVGPSQQKCWYEGPRMKPRRELYWAETPAIRPPEVEEGEFELRWKGRPHE